MSVVFVFSFVVVLLSLLLYPLLAPLVWPDRSADFESDAAEPTLNESERALAADCATQLSARLSQFARLATHVQSFPPHADFAPRWAAARDLRALVLRIDAPEASTSLAVDGSFESWFNALLRVASDALPTACRSARIAAVRPNAPQSAFERQFAYAALLRERFVRPRNASLVAHDRVQRNVVVVGGGPLGLASALEAYRRGAAVRGVLEKRLNYTRNIWFDLYDKPWSRAADWLRAVGGDIVFVEQERHNGSSATITIRAQFLERLLAMAAYTLGIDVAYGRIAVGLCRDADGRAFLAAVDDAALAQPLPSDFALCKAEPWAPLAAELPFDVVVAADGAESDTRRLAQMTVMRQEHFSIANEDLEVPHMHQTTTVVDFRTVDGRCPKLRVDESGRVLDPRYPSMVLKTVSNVFKRFYFRHCHMQIMWTLEKGEQIMRDVRLDNGTLPWAEILDVVKLLLVEPPADVAALQQAVERVNVFVVVIDAAPTNTLLWDAAAPKNQPAIVTLVGDALVSAHYRLGIGINQGLSSLDELGELLHSLSLAKQLTLGKATTEVRLKQSITEKRVHAMLQFQLTVMFLETYCEDLLVFFDSSTDNLWSNVRVYAKRPETKPLDYFASGPLAVDELKKRCGAYWRKTIIET